MEANGYLTIN